eukprot:SAG22_NODE_31_length_27697_cov_7.384376_16_plen_88_part_00
MSETERVSGHGAAGALRAIGNQVLTVTALIAASTTRRWLLAAPAALARPLAVAELAAVVPFFADTSRAVGLLVRVVRGAKNRLQDNR